MDDSKLSNFQDQQAQAIKVNEEHSMHSKVPTKVIDAHVVDADILEDSNANDINPNIFESSHEAKPHQSIELDNYGRSIELDEAERIKDRLNESFTEQFGTASYSPELKQHYAHQADVAKQQPLAKGTSLVPVAKVPQTKVTQTALTSQAALATTDSNLSPEERQQRDLAHQHIKQLFDGVDVENLAKGLDVLKQVKDINEQRRNSETQEQDEIEDDYFSDSLDDEDSSLQGMHFVAEDEQDNLDDNLDFSGSQVEHGSGSTSSSRAIARSAGNIGAFIKAANMVPMLTEEQERDLAKRLREFGDVDAARQLVTSHLRFVVSVARKFTGYGLPLADLIQEGNIGLMKAVKNYDPDVGHGLAAFASSWIKAEMFDYVIRNWRMVKVATTKAQRKLFFNLRKSKKRLGWMSESERSELANDLGVSVSDVTEMEARLAGSDVGFDLGEDDSSDKSVAVTVSPSSYLEDENSNFALNYENSNYSAWEIKKLHEALSTLDSRSNHIIKRRWLDEHKATLQELSKELGVSIERVRQLENNAMNKVKGILLNDGFNDDEQVLALEHHESGASKAKKSVASSRTKASATKRASGKGARERLKSLPLKTSHQLAYKEKDEEKKGLKAKATAKKTSTKKAAKSKDLVENTNLTGDSNQELNQE